jgi:hypothetical protein
VVEITETTVSPITNFKPKSMSLKRIEEDAIWMQLAELPKHAKCIKRLSFPETVIRSAS